MLSKIKTIDEYFDSQIGHRMWVQGYRLFETRNEAIPVKDGIYRAMLKQIVFRNEFKSPATCIFVFITEYPSQIKLEKYYNISKSEGIFDLLEDLKTLGFKVKQRTKFQEIMDNLQYSTISAELDVKVINKDIIIKINSASFETKANQPPARSSVSVETIKSEPAKAIIIETVSEVAKVENVDPEPIAEVSEATREPEVAEEAPQTVEVDIFPGTKIKFKLKGELLDGIVYKTFEDDGELVVTTADGKRELIPGDDIVAIIK